MSEMWLVNELERKLDDRKPEIPHVVRPFFEWISASAVQAAGVKAATIGLNDNGWIVASFADGQEQQIQAVMKIPHDMDTDEDLAVCIGWSSPTISQDCDWEMTYLIVNLGQSTDAAGTLMQSYEESGSTADGKILSAFTIAAAGISSTYASIHIVVERDGNDGNDNLGAVAEVHGMALRYTPN